jgi:hypothetical protein
VRSAQGLPGLTVDGLGPRQNLQNSPTADPWADPSSACSSETKLSTLGGKPSSCTIRCLTLGCPGARFNVCTYTNPAGGPSGSLHTNCPKHLHTGTRLNQAPRPTPSVTSVQSSLRSATLCAIAPILQRKVSHVLHWFPPLPKLDANQYLLCSL